LPQLTGKLFMRLIRRIQRCMFLREDESLQ
jgi:hypothetical protein